MWKLKYEDKVSNLPRDNSSVPVEFSHTWGKGTEKNA